MKDIDNKNKPPSVMIVDDTPDNLNLLSAILKECGYHVRPAPGGKQALEAVKSDPPDLVLLDIMMPDMDGYEVCRVLKSGRKTKDIPVIFLTALDSRQDEEKGFKLGAVDYITKPFINEVVKARVNTHLQLKRHQDRLEQIVSERTAELIQANKDLLLEIDERKRAEETVRNSLTEKEALIKELYHRTYNNMQVISSMLNAQASYVEEEKVRIIFREMSGRINSMAKVHQKLYQSKDLSSVSLKEYIIEISELLMQGYIGPANNIDISMDLEDEKVLIDTAVPCGLIINELITNALKYAFPGGRRGLLKISLHRIDNSNLELRVSDNGIGVPKGFDFKINRGMGLQIIYDIAEKQLAGKADFESNNGLSAVIRFNDKLYHKRV